MIPLTSNLQSLRGWEIDWLSLAIGAVLGILLTLGFQRLVPMVVRWRKQMSGRVRRGVAWMRTGVETRYLSECVEHAQSYHLGFPRAELSQVYVPPRLLISPENYDPFHASDGDSYQLYQLWPNLASGIVSPTTPTAAVEDLLRNGRRVVITGGLGAGKSSLLAYCAYRLASDGLAEPKNPDETPSPWLPVLLHLAEVSLEHETAEPLDPVDLIITALQKRVTPLTGPGLKDLIRQKIKAGHLVLLLDGYDDASADIRRLAANWLHRLLADHDNCRVFVASGPIGYGLLLAQEFVLTTVLPWRVGRAERFGQQWGTLLNAKLPRTNRYWLPGQPAMVTTLRLWHDIILYANKKGTAVLPPTRWADLCERTLPLFSTEAAKKGAPLESPEPITLAFWQRLAYELLVADALSLSRMQVEALAAEIAIADPNSSPGKLQKSITQCTLFRTWANGSVSVFSNIWRDYLAAGHMVAQNLKDVVKTHLREPRWALAMRFYVAQTGATEWAAHLLSAKDPSPTRDALFQVASWMPEASDSGEWRRQTLILLGQMIRQATFAQVLRLRAVVALAQTGETGVFRFMSQLLERSDPFLRFAGVVGLSALSPERALPLLDDRLYDDDAQVRETAVYALAWLHHPSVERPLISALLSEDEILSNAAAESLALNGGESLNILKEALKEQSVFVRRAAIMGLSLLDEPWVLPLLAETERLDAEWVVQSAANMAQDLIRQRRKPVEWRPLQARSQSWLQDYARDEGRVVPDGPAAMPFLVQILTESSWPNLRMAAARTLGQMPNLDALPALETAVRDDDEGVREAAFVTLCRIRRAFT